MSLAEWKDQVLKEQKAELNESQDLPEPIQEFDMEDPARSWIDLVMACKTGDPSIVRTVLADAKTSQWTHDKLDVLEAEDDLNDLKYARERMPDSEEEMEELHLNNALEELDKHGKFVDLRGTKEEQPPNWSPRTKVTARNNGYRCPKCGVYVNTGQCHTCHM